MKLNRKSVLDFIFRLTVVVVANTLISFVTVWFLEPAKLYSGGAVGIAQLIKRLIESTGVETINLGWFIFMVNIPITIVGIKFVSTKFSILSVIAVLIQTVVTIILTNVVPEAPFKPIEVENGSIPYNMYGYMLTLCITGGVLGGIATGVALRLGTSTGGFDVLGQALALKKNISIGSFTMVLNVLIAIFGGAVLQGSWIICLFTIIRMVLNSLVIDKIHTAYSYIAVRIFSKNGLEISHAIMEEMSRGCTIERVMGAHSGTDSIEVYSVVSSYEVDKVYKIIKRYDDHAFVTTAPVKDVWGKFIKHSIV